MASNFSSLWDDDVEKIEPMGDDLRSLRRGDMLGVEGVSILGTYWHCGIYLGFENGVAHFTGESAILARLKIDCLTKFIAGRPLIRIIFKRGKCLDPETTARKAEQFVKESEKWGTFNLLKNNCEHFAMTCKTGRAVSKQVGALDDLSDNPLLSPMFSLAEKGVAMSGGSGICSSRPSSSFNMCGSGSIGSMSNGSGVCSSRPFSGFDMCGSESIGSRAAFTSGGPLASTWLLGSKGNDKSN